MTFWGWLFPWMKEEAESDRGIEGLHEAEKAKENSLLAQQEIQTQGQEVRKVAQSLRTMRAQNHFGDAIERSMRTR
jgi:hypothetical protein